MWDCKTSNFSIFTFVHAKDLKFCTRSYYIRMEKLPKRWRHTSGDSKINLPINMTTTHLHNWGYLPPPLCPASRFSCATFTHSRSFDGQAGCFIFMAAGFWTQYFMKCGLKPFYFEKSCNVVPPIEFVLLIYHSNYCAYTWPTPKMRLILSPWLSRLHFLMQNHVVPPIELLCLYLANSQNLTQCITPFSQKRIY